MYPEIHLTSSISISTYFLIISLASTFSALWFLKRARDRKLSRVIAVDFTLAVLAGGFIGARLLHVAYEEPLFYAENPWRILQIWQGGFVYLGGLLGAAIAGYLFCDWKKEPFFYWADTAAPPAALGYALGRIACLLNGCCYGKLCELPWAIELHGRDVHPTQIYASLWEAAVLVLLLKSETRLKMPGQLFAFWLILHSVGRMMMEHFRDDPRGPLIAGFSLGTLMSLGMGLTGAAVLWVLRKK